MFVKPLKKRTVLAAKPKKPAGRVLTPEQLRKEQLKKNKKPSKGGTGYSGVNRV